MPEAVVIALISAVSAGLASFLNYLAQRPTRKAVAEVKEQVVNDHEKAPYPNTRDELTSTRETSERTDAKMDILAGQVAHLSGMVSSVAERLAMSTQNRKDVEDTLSSRDELTDDRLEAAIVRHNLDMQRVEAELHALNGRLTEHPLACAAFRPTLLPPTPSFTERTPD